MRTNKIPTGSARVGNLSIDHWRTVKYNLERKQGLKSIDIASFRIGHTPGLLDSLCSLMDFNVPVRILIGLGTSDNNGGTAPADPCLGTAEELLYMVERNKTLNPNCKGHMSIRYVHDNHIKMWLFHRRAPHRNTAIVGSHNLNMSSWAELSVELDQRKTIKCLKEIFTQAWSTAKPLKLSSFTKSILDARVF